MLSNDQPELILQHDLDPDFIEALSIALAWEYDSLFRLIQAEDATPIDCREEEFNKRRGDSVRGALARVSKQFRVPYEFKRLNSNGQHKIVVRAGRLIIFQEAIDAFNEDPKAADYKVELANAHGFVRQLELDLGDRPIAPQSWSGYVLAVLLHGPKGENFTSADEALGSLSLGVPDARYSHWILRLDLFEMAMFGRKGIQQSVVDRTDSPAQVDDVVVKLKKKNSGRNVVGK